MICTSVPSVSMQVGDMLTRLWPSITSWIEEKRGKNRLGKFDEAHLNNPILSDRAKNPLFHVRPTNSPPTMTPIIHLNLSISTSSSPPSACPVAYLNAVHPIPTQMV